jgi:hypothetical protein
MEAVTYSIFNLSKIGSWKEGRPHGKGRFLLNEKVVYDGHFKEGKFDGFGIFEDGVVQYRGNWCLNMRDGIG